jgi:hypothetical protein
MMSNVRILVLLLVSLCLGILVWLDNRPDGSPMLAVDQGEHLATAAEQGDHGDAEPADDERAAGAEAESAEDTEDTLDASRYLKSEETAISNPLAALDIGSLRETVERPLFAPSRRRPPEADQKEEVAAEPAKPATFELLGVALSGARAIAVLRKKSDGTSYRVQAGDMLAGWQVAKVESKSVLLERPEGVTETVPLLRQ